MSTRPAVRALAASLAAFAAGAALAVPSASAEFGIAEAEVRSVDANGDPSLQAGSHPFAFVTSFAMNTVEEGGEVVPDGAVQDLRIDLPEGFAGDPYAVRRCSAAEFIEIDGDGQPGCPDASAVGISALKFDFQPIPPGAPAFLHVPVYNLAPPPGSAARLGFVVLGVPAVVDLGLNSSPPYNVVARSANIAQAALFYSAVTSVWGDPGHPLHDPVRGDCLETEEPAPPDQPPTTGELCSVEGSGRPFITLPRSCGPLETDFFVRSWPRWEMGEDGIARPLPSRTDEERASTPPGTVECSKVGFAADIDARPTSERAESPTGLEFDLRVDNPGLVNPSEEAVARSDIKRAEVTLPEGMTVNPSQAEGLEVCSESELARETASSEFGTGCPAASRIGLVEVESPLLEDEVLHGSIFVAEPYENRFGSLLAIYQVIKSRELGIVLRLAGEVEPDPRTGRLVTTFDDLPQLPFSEFRLRFREGGRSPLVTPPRCGAHEVEARFTPWADPGATHSRTASFEIEQGVGGRPCPGAQPFSPGFAAGTLANQAGSHSPFLLRLTRRDGDQDLVRFDSILPKGVTAKLAGVPWCPDAAIARARERDGKDELARPSCPAASQIGTVQGGAGVGSQLTYVPGKVYLAGPVGGAPISVVGIVPAVAGPFDVGTIVVRQALDLDPVSGQAKVVSAASDDLPHILAGIPLRVRDIQVSVDRPNFTLNPTSCKPMATLAGIWGGGSNVFSVADDFPVLRRARFQAAGCAALGFEPKLAIKLRGGVKRGAHPALRAHVRPRPGDANFSRAVVTLPTSAFLDQAHIRTICTRVQFAAGPGHGALCPKGARYGFARAWSPLLDGPVTGPVYLRSSDNNLPDLVAALTGPPSAAVQVELSARIDSVKGGIRSTFTGIPDVPVSRFILDMQGGKKGLIVNSRHLCFKPKRNRARANLRGQNGRISRSRPVVRAVRCKKKSRARAAHARASDRLARGSAAR